MCDDLRFTVHTLQYSGAESDDFRTPVMSRLVLIFLPLKSLHDLLTYQVTTRSRP